MSLRCFCLHKCDHFDNVSPVRSNGQIHFTHLGDCRTNFQPTAKSALNVRRLPIQRQCILFTIMTTCATLGVQSINHTFIPSVPARGEGCAKKKRSHGKRTVTSMCFESEGKVHANMFVMYRRIISDKNCLWFYVF